MNRSQETEVRRQGAEYIRHRGLLLSVAGGEHRGYTLVIKKYIIVARTGGIKMRVAIIISIILITICSSSCLADVEQMNINVVDENKAMSIDPKAQRLLVPGEFKTIQDAINAAQAGQVVHIKAGKYREAIILKDGVSLEGEGREKVTLCCDMRQGRVLTIANCRDVRISGIKFMHENAGDTEKDFVGRFAAIKISDSAVEIDNCTMTCSGHNGISIEGQQACRIFNCIISNNMLNGIMLSDSKGAVIKGNTCSDNGNNGITVQKGAEAIINDNICERNKCHGISAFESGTRAILKNNTCGSNRYSGIFLGENCKAKATGNKCNQNECGIRVDGGGTDATLIENMCGRNVYNGIYFHGRAEGDVHHNNTSENKWHGISGEADCKVNVTDNTSERNGRAGIYTGSGQVRLARNNLKDNGYISGGHVYAMFCEGKIAELESIAQELRRSKSRYYDEGWQISTFYDSIHINSDDRSKYEPMLERIKQWIKDYPESVTPQIVLAKQYIAIGWKARGGGYANTVTEEGAEEFKANLEKAREVLIAAEKLKVKDPELYSTWVYVDLGLGRQKEMRQMFDKGVAIDSQYWPLYYRYSWGLMPRWYGSRGDYERFANEAVQLSGKKDIYAWLAYGIAGCADVNEFRTMGFNYEKLKAYWNEHELEISEQFDSCKLNKACFIACVFEKKEDAKNLFLRIGQDWDKIWKREYIFTSFKNWAFGKGPYPKAQDPKSGQSLVEQIIQEILN